MASFPKRRRARIIEGGRRKGGDPDHSQRKEERERTNKVQRQKLSPVSARINMKSPQQSFLSRDRPRAAAGQAGQQVKSSRPPQKRPFTSTVAKRGERARKKGGRTRTNAGAAMGADRADTTDTTDGRTESVGRIYYSFRFQPTPKPKPTPKPNDVMWVTSQEVFAPSPMPPCVPPRNMERFRWISALLITVLTLLLPLSSPSALDWGRRGNKKIFVFTIWGEGESRE